MTTTTRPGEDEQLAQQVAEEIRRRDRRHKVWLLLVSLGTLALLAAAALKENYLAPWRMIQLGYRDLLEQKAKDAWGKKVADDFQVEIKQVVVPALESTDRCVSCHNGLQDPRMKDVRQPHRVHPGDHLRWHEPAKFGCTICHRGQGQALDFPAAKGHGQHWDYPLLPVRLTQSSCALCHGVDEIKDRGAPTLALGRALFVAKGCQACHKLDGRGGSMGPALDGVGSKVAGQLPMGRVKGPHTLPQWLAEHFDDPQRIVAQSKMRPPQLSAAENEALTTYMLSLQSRPVPASYLTADKHLALYRAAHPPDLPGEQLYARFCSECHDSGEYGPYDRFFATFIPAVRGPSLVQRAAPAYVEAMIREGRPGTIMPAWGPQGGGLSEGDVRRLRQHLLARAPTGATSAEPSSQPTRSAQPISSRTAQGGQIFARHCSACHGSAGRGLLGPSLSTTVFQRAASDGFLFDTIASGRLNTAMPTFLAEERAGGGLSAGEIAALVAHLRVLGRPPAAGVAGPQDKETNP